MTSDYLENIDSNPKGQAFYISCSADQKARGEKCLFCTSIDPSLRKILQINFYSKCRCLFSHVINILE